MAVAATPALTLPGDCEVRITRLFAARAPLVFDCYARPERLTRWLGPEGWDFAICDNDLVAGGRYRWLWRNAQGQELAMHGEYLKVTAREIVRTEVFEQDPTRSRSIGWLLLAESDGGTTVTTSVLFPTTEARDRALASGMEKAVASSFGRLDLLLATDDSDRAAAYCA